MQPTPHLSSSSPSGSQAYLTTTWRLVLTPPAPGAWNMAVDEALLESVGKGESPPLLRLYAWRPACLSLGYAQSMAEVDRQGLASNGWDLVRRPTGGKAILHTDEITYSVIAPGEEPRILGGVLESYQRLSRALLQALHDLDVPAMANPLKVASGNSPQGPVCFEVPSNYEITVHGKKLIGSAQARKKEGVLQHGSLPLYGDLGRILKALRFDSQADRSQAAERLQARAATLADVSDRAYTWDELAAALIGAFRRVLNLSFRTQPLTVIERQRAAELSAQKYAHPAWLERV